MHLIRPLIIRSANLADTKKASHSPACFLPYCFLLINCISYRKTSAISFFVRLSSFFAHNLFTNFQYHKTIKNNNRFLIDFFHTFLSFEAGFMSVSFLIYHPDTLLQSPFLFTTMKKVSCINA